MATAEEKAALAAAREQYTAAAKECRKAWLDYMQVGAYEECLGYPRFYLPAPPGVAHDDFGNLT